MTIIYFPYLSMNDTEEIDLGIAKVWNYDKKANEHITDDGLRAEVKELLSLKVDRNSREISNIGVLSIDGNSVFDNFDKDVEATANEVRILLFLVCIARNIGIDRGPNTGHYGITTENFTMYVHNFQLGSDSTGETSGYIIRKSNFDLRGNMKVFRPIHVPTPMEFSYSGLLLKRLVLLRKRSKSLYNRILSASDIFSSSYYNDDNIRVHPRILMQLVAFEVLLDIPPGNQQRRIFKDEVERYLVRPYEKKIRYCYNPNCYESRSLKVMWADRFYSLRNKIIHNGSVRFNDLNFRQQPHVLIAPLFFFLLIKELINGQYARRKFYDGLSINTIHAGVETYKGFKYNDQDYLASTLEKLDPSGSQIPYC